LQFEVENVVEKMFTAVIPYRGTAKKWVPQIFELIGFIHAILHRVPQIVTFLPGKVAAKFFLVL
jgi:hypothetical protein